MRLNNFLSSDGLGKTLTCFPMSAGSLNEQHQNNDDQD